MVTRTLLEQLRSEILNIQFVGVSIPNKQVSFDGVDDPEKAQSGLFVIDLSTPKITQYMDEDSDSTIYIYIHHTSRLDCKLLKEQLQLALDDMCIGDARLVALNEEKEFVGALAGSTLKAERVKFNILY